MISLSKNNSRLQNHRFQILSIIIIIALSLTVVFESALLFYTRDLGSRIIVRSQASLADVRASVYWDITCTKEITFIDWGTVEPSKDYAISLYIRNEGTIELTSWLTQENFLPPEGSQYLNVTWTFGTNPLFPDRVRKVDLWLHVSPGLANGTIFKFDIIVNIDGVAP